MLEPASQSLEILNLDAVKIEQQIPCQRSPKAGDRVPINFAQGRRDDNQNGVLE